jgi:hypothetical protein
VVSQIENVHRELGAGILDLTLMFPMGEKSLRTIELLGTKVIPRIRNL